MRPHHLGAACGLLLVTTALVAPPPARGQGPDARALRIALPQSMFPDASEADRKSAGKTYQRLMRTNVGLPIDIVHLPDPMTAAARLDGGEAQMGVFQGFEFAWAKAKYPRLRPLLIAVPFRETHACLVTKAGGKTESLADIKGKLAIPSGSRGHVRLFLEKLQSAEPRGEGRELVKADDVDTALEDVVDGVLAGAVVDGSALKSFEVFKPGRFRRLKVLARSETFPTGVMAYCEGGVPPETLKKFREGMAGDEAIAGPLLREMKVKGFDVPPANFDEQLQRVLRDYPPPGVKGK